MTGLSKLRHILVLLAFPISFGHSAEQETNAPQPNIFLKAVIEGHGHGIKRVDGVLTARLFKDTPKSVYVTPGRHNFEWQLYVPVIRPVFGVTGATVITRCMWIDVTDNETYIVETKVNSRKPLYRIRTESGERAHWGNCDVIKD